MCGFRRPAPSTCVGKPAGRLMVTGAGLLAMAVIGVIASAGRHSPREAPIGVVSLGTVLRKRPGGLSEWLVWRRARPRARNGSADLLPRRVSRLPREPRSSAAAVLR